MLKDADQTERYAHIVARAWADPEFKQRLLKEPLVVFKEYRLEPPESVKEVRVVENSAEVMHFVLPAAPTSVEHTELSRLPVQVLDSPCHGHECGNCRHPCA
jgi:hypothetical protein